MNYTNSKLVDYKRLSPNCNKRTKPITKITIHHMAGNLSVETCGKVFAARARKASSNYGVGTDGRIGLYVEECNRAWTSSNPENDYQAVTIEVANDGKGPNWHVSDKALAALIELCVDICKRNNIKKLVYTNDASGNLTRHNMFAATTCPGPYLQSKFPYIVEQVNKKLDLSIIPTNNNLASKEQKNKITVKEFQLAAIADGFKFPKYGADGKWGSECETVAKAAVVKKRTIYSNKNLTKLVQKALGLTVDGLCGSKTEAAIKTFQKEHGLKVDGAIGLIGWKVLLGI
jgi:hypothetical protein